MKRKLAIAALFLTAAAVLAILAPAPQVLAVGRGVSVSGTIYGSYDYTFEGKGAWVGNALLAFGDKPALRATFADRNTSHGRKENGAIYGTETISLTFTDGSGSFDVLASYHGIPGVTPSLYTLSETGSIANGSGKYAQVSGQLTVHGPFLLPNPAVTPGEPPWIAEIHGVIFDLNEY